MDFPILDVSYKWNPTRCDLLYLASFTYQNGFEVHPCCSPSHLHFFLWLNNIPLCGCTTVCLSIRLLMDIWAVLTLWLLWLVLLWICMYMSLLEYLFTSLSDVNLGLKLLGCVVTVYLTFNCQTVFLSNWIILYSHQQYTIYIYNIYIGRVPISPHPSQYLLISLFLLVLILVLNSYNDWCEVVCYCGFG